MPSDDTVVHWLLGSISLAATVIGTILAWLGANSIRRLEKVEREKQDVKTAEADRATDLEAAQRSRAELREEVKELAKTTEAGFIRVFDKIDVLRDDIAGRPRRPPTV